LEGQTEKQDEQVDGGAATILGDVRMVGEGSYEGRLVDVLIEDGRVAAVGDLSRAGATVVDLEGHVLVPAFVDSHVHLAYLRMPEELADGGIAAVVDLAVPLGELHGDQGPLRVIQAGPMVTAVGGYPTQSWGAGGYGVECADADEARTAISQLVAAGAGVIKLPVTDDPVLDESALQAAVDAAHGSGLPVASHAMSDDAAALAAQVGVDVLAHTPTGSLTDATIAAWSDRAVISTLAAFGGSDRAVNNLRALHDAGTTILYGTDFGNLRTTGIVEEEIHLLQEAGLTGAEILAAGTHVAADWWGLEGLGRIEVGAPASVLVLDSDPEEDPTALARPVQVWIGGQRRDG
jgi:imidazolonepropionase-like amidohydrolase